MAKHCNVCSNLYHAPDNGFRMCLAGEYGAFPESMENEQIDDIFASDNADCPCVTPIDPNYIFQLGRLWQLINTLKIIPTVIR